MTYFKYVFKTLIFDQTILFRSFLGGYLMKRSKLGLLLVLSGTMILASCGGGAPKAKKYRLTFHQTEPGEIEDKVVVVTKGKTTNPEVWEQEPDINPKVGYSAEWEEYDVETMESDLTVEPEYTAIIFTATFVNRVTGQTIGTDSFTVEDDSLDYPALPIETGYTYAWEDVTISAQNLTVYCDRTANVHTIKFFADEEKTQLVCEPITFTVETESIPEPVVPYVEGYDGSWGDYDLTADQDIELVPHYELHNYYIQFQVDGEDFGDPVGYHYNDTWATIEKPSLDQVPGYTAAWPENVQLTFSDTVQIVNASVTPNEYFVRFAGSSEVTSVTFGQPYTLGEAAPQYCSWYYDDKEVAYSGDKWLIASDVTLTPKLDSAYRVLDFENDTDIELFSIFAQFESFAVVNDEGIDGSRALEFTRTNTTASDCKLSISKEYLAAVFADPNVKALSFYAKGTGVTNNFRHISVDPSYTNNNSDVKHCFERNNSGWGITNEYKQFYLTREVWSQMTASDHTIQYNVGGGKLWLDNFKISEESYFEYDRLSFDNGYFRIPDATHAYLYGPDSSQADFLVTTNSANNIVSLDYDNYSDGIRSIKVERAEKVDVTFMLRNKFAYANLPDEGIFFDFYTNKDLNGHFAGQDKGAIVDGNKKPFVDENVAIKGGVWTTIHLRKDQIKSGSDGNFLYIQGSAAELFNIDNIRVASDSYSESFETTKTFHIGEYGYAVGYDLADGTVADKCRDVTKNYKFLIGWNACTDIAITDEKASKEAYSLKITKTSGGTFHINPQWVDLMDEDSTISFDIYTEDANRLTCQTSGPSDRTIEITKGVWTRITLTLDDFESGLGRFTTNAFGAGTFYLDNFVLNI